MREVVTLNSCFPVYDEGLPATSYLGFPGEKYSGEGLGGKKWVVCRAA